MLNSNQVNDYKITNITFALYYNAIILYFIEVYDWEASWTAWMISSSVGIWCSSRWIARLTCLESVHSRMLPLSLGTITMCESHGVAWPRTGSIMSCSSSSFILSSTNGLMWNGVLLWAWRTGLTELSMWRDSSNYFNLPMLPLKTDGNIAAYLAIALVTSCFLSAGLSLSCLSC